MNISKVITQLKSAPIFGGRVAGGAAYAYAIADQAWMDMPAAYVIPGHKTAGQNMNLNALYQIVTEHIRIIAILDNTADRRGQTTAETLEEVQADIFSAILNWRPDWDYALIPDVDPQPLNREARGLYFVEAELLEMDRARLKYEWVFGLDVTIDETDGWQQPAGPFVEVDIYAVPVLGSGREIPILAQVILNDPDKASIAGEGSVVVRV